jgi:hypothetical protein
MHICLIDRWMYELIHSQYNMPSSIIVLEVRTKHDYMFINVVRWIPNHSAFYLFVFKHFRLIYLYARHMFDNWN